MNTTSHSRAIWLIPFAVTLCVTGCGGQEPAQQSPGSKTVGFSNGKVEFVVPQEYVQSSEPGDTIVIRPSNEAGITLRFNLHYVEDPDLPADVGLQFVQVQAEKKGLKTKRIGDKIMFTEVGIREEGGRTFEMTFWPIGLQDVVVIVSAEIDQSQKDEQTVIDCMNAVPDIVQSIKKR